ncbi:hypothetical protein SprV_0802504400 [Sparganum proliferum]
MHKHQMWYVTVPKEDLAYNPATSTSPYTNNHTVITTSKRTKTAPSLVITPPMSRRPGTILPVPTAAPITSTILTNTTTSLTSTADKTTSDVPPTTTYTTTAPTTGNEDSIETCVYCDRKFTYASALSANCESIAL